MYDTTTTPKQANEEASFSQQADRIALAQLID